MKCPNCGLENPSSALRCDCGYDFEKKQVERKQIPDEEERREFAPSEGISNQKELGVETKGWVQLKLFRQAQRSQWGPNGTS